HTEADPAALLIQFHVAFGSVVGRQAHFQVEADRHYTNLFASIVGESSKARKGTSWGHIRRVFEKIDPEWAQEHIMSGLSSGEGLIWAVRDRPKTSSPKTSSKRASFLCVEETDSEIKEKRLLVLESEFASVLKVLKREGNTLS